MCGENGQQNGGLEIHHIVGRTSDSALNSSCLCKKCHATIGHSEEEEQMLFAKTLEYMYNIQYMIADEDIEFMKNNTRLLTSEKLKQWANNL